MYVQISITSLFIQYTHDMIDLWAPLKSWRHVVSGRSPFAIQISPTRIRAKMPAHRPVWVCIWHDKKSRMLPHFFSHCIIFVAQALQKTLGAPLSHTLPWMLARCNKEFLRALTNHEHVNAAPVERCTKCAQAAERGCRNAADQLLMTFIGVGRKVCKPDGGLAGRHGGAPFQDARARIERGVGASEPVFSRRVVRGAHLVIRPAGRVAGSPGVGDPHLEVPTGLARCSP